MYEMRLAMSQASKKALHVENAYRLFSAIDQDLLSERMAGLLLEQVREGSATAFTFKTLSAYQTVRKQRDEVALTRELTISEREELGLL